MDLISDRPPGPVSLQKLSIEAIAKHAGVGKMTIYRWWPSKAALVIDSFVNNHVALTPIDEEGPAFDALRKHLRSVARVYGEPEGRLVAQLLAECQYDEATLREFRERFWNDRYKAVVKLIQRCIDEGSLRKDISPEAAGELLYSPLYHRLLFHRGNLDADAADEILSVALRGLAPHGESA
jgi:AcrR family transcriptional regulator